MKKAFIYLVIAMLLLSFIPYQPNIVVAEGNLQDTEDYQEQEGVILAKVKGEEVEFFEDLDLEDPSLLIPDDTEITILTPNVDEEDLDEELSNNEESEYALIRYEFVEEVEDSDEEQEVVVEGFVHNDFLFHAEEAEAYRAAREKEADEGAEEIEEDKALEDDGAEEDLTEEDNAGVEEDDTEIDQEEVNKEAEEEDEDLADEVNQEDESEEESNVANDEEDNVGDETEDVVTEEVEDNSSEEEKVEPKQNLMISTMSAQIKESQTSKLGHFKSGTILIYETINGKSIKASASHKNAVYYIKKEATVGKDTFYLLSKQPSATKELLGWVNAKDLSVLNHVGIDRVEKFFTINGKGKATTKAWGGSQDTVYADLTKYKDETFYVNLTEKVGNNTWYRGILAGKEVWVHSSYVDSAIEKSTSKLGHFKSGTILIYETINGKSIKASASHKNAVYYIKKEATVGKDTFYLLSKQPSATQGIVGWVNAKDLSVLDHVVIDRFEKSLIINGKGKATTKAWGGSQDTVYADLTKYKDETIYVNQTEKVGNNTWYRGILAGKEVWVHSSYVDIDSPVEKSTSKLGHFKSGTILIYETINGKSIKASASHKNAVYYIKKEATVGKDTFYLLSKQPSATQGIVGWVNAKDLSVLDHVGLDRKEKIFTINGNGKATTKAWGGSQDTVYADLTKYKGETLHVNLTEKVGNNTWYRGILAGKQVWVHSSYVNENGNEIITNTKYNITLDAAVAIQAGLPIIGTDKYRNSPAYVSAEYVSLTESAIINGSGVNIRKDPDTTVSNIVFQLGKNDPIKILKETKGTTVSGSTLWYEIEYIGTGTNKGKKGYVHSSLVNKSSTNTGVVTADNLNVRSGQSNSSHIFGSLKKNDTVTIISKGSSWHQINYDTWRRPTNADIKSYMNPSNNDQFQHLRLDTTLGVTASELNKFLKGKGILDGKGSSFINGTKKYGVNEAYLIAHAQLETGHGTSTLAKGVWVDGNGKVTRDSKGVATKTSASKHQVYNMYGIGAVDSDPLNGGAKTAFDNGWFTPEAAIEGGADWIGRQYINNTHKQNTLYKMKWNPNMATGYAWKQYATDIGWAVKQIGTIKAVYDAVNNPIYHYDIPQYN